MRTELRRDRYEIHTEVAQQESNPVTVSARAIGKLGGRPKGSFSSPLAMWLRREITQRRREGYRCREAFDILRETEKPDGHDAFELTDHTSDEHEIEPNARVTWCNYRKIWHRFSGDKNRFLSP